MAHAAWVVRYFGVLPNASPEARPECGREGSRPASRQYVRACGRRRLRLVAFLPSLSRTVHPPCDVYVENFGDAVTLRRAHRKATGVPWSGSRVATDGTRR